MRLSLRRILRFRLSTLLCFFVCCGLGFGWWKDHNDLRRQLADGEVRRHALQTVESDHLITMSHFGSENPFSLEVFDRVHWVAIQSDESGWARRLWGRRVDELRQFLADADLDARRAAVCELDRRELDGISPLINAIRDEDEGVRWVALRALDGFAKRAPAPTAAAAVAAVRLEAQKTPSPFVVYAARVLHRLNCRDEALLRLEELLSASDVETRRWAVMALVDIGPSDAEPCVPKLIPRLKDPNLTLRRTVFMALGELAKPTAVRHIVLRAYREQEDEGMRRAAAGALGRLEVREMMQRSAEGDERSSSLE